MNARITWFVEPAESPPGFGVRQSSAAFPPATRAVAPLPKAPEDWRSPRRCRLGAPLLSAVVAVLLTATPWFTTNATELRVGHATVLPGETISVPITLANSSAAVAAQFDLSFSSSSVNFAGLSNGAASSGHILDHEQLASNQWRILVYSMTNAAILPGTLVRLNFTIPTNAPDGVIPLALSHSILAQATGQRVEPLTQISGTLTVSSQERLTSVRLGTAGALRTTIVGLPGRALTLQGSPDLFHWADLGRYTNETGTLVLTNPAAAGRDAYFYRTVFRDATNSPAIPAPSLSDPGVLPEGRMRFRLNSLAGSAWRIEGSPDLVHWGNYGMATNVTGTLLVTNRPFGDPDSYFHRVSQP